MDGKRVTFLLLVALVTLIMLLLPVGYINLSDTSFQTYFVKTLRRNNLSDAASSFQTHFMKPLRRNNAPEYPFKAPPYVNERPLDIIVHNDVCIETNPRNPHVSRIVIYNSDPKLLRSNYIVMHGYFPSMKIYWPVKRVVDDIPSDRRIMPVPAFFFMQNYPSNLFHFFEDGIRGKFLLYLVCIFTYFVMLTWKQYNNSCKW